LVSPRASAWTSVVMAASSASPTLKARASSALMARNRTTATPIKAITLRRRIRGHGSRPARRGGRDASGVAELHEPLDRRLLMLKALGQRQRVLGGQIQEVLHAPRRVVGQGIHARQVLLGA